MGLDIFISTDKKIDEQDKFVSLSRKFLRINFQQHDDNDEELNQISEISNVDLTPLLEMTIPDTGYLESQLDDTENEEETKRIKDEIAQIEEQYSPNIELVIDTLQKLNTALKAKPDYYKQLHLTEPNEAYINYFKKYSVDVEPNEYGSISYSDENFGIDIRTLLNYLIFAKSQGATKTYFKFG